MAAVLDQARARLAATDLLNLDAGKFGDGAGR